MPAAQSSLNPTRHLDENQLLPAHAACPVCEAPYPVAAPHAAASLQDKPIITLIACSACGAISASRLPRDDYLRAYYAAYYDLFAETPKVAFKDVQRFARHIVEVTIAMPRRGSFRLLDYGGGDGRIAIETGRLLLDRGAVTAVSIDVFDLSGTAVADPGHPLITVKTCALESDLTNRRYDGVVASAVFEHIPRPRSAMAGLLASLTPGGWLYARTPYMLPVLRIGRRLGLRIPFGFPAHIHDLGPAFWNRCLDTLGLASTHRLLRSQPSIIETTLADYPVRTIAAWCLKLPWRWLGDRWPLVGGWEVWTGRRTES